MKRVFVFLCLCVLTLSSCKSIDVRDYFKKCVEITLIKEESIFKATGTLISDTGDILTNKHVVEGYLEDAEIYVYYEKEYIEASITKISEEYDFALLKIEKKTDYFYNISKDYSIGDEIYAIGNPSGLGLTLYKGIISSDLKYITIDNSSILSLSITIEFEDGCSGGPVFNHKGELIGIMTYRLINSMGYIPGISFILPADSIEQFIG